MKKKRNQKIGERLDQIIKEWGSSEKLAQQYRFRTQKNVSADLINKQRNGDRTLTPEKAKAYAQILNIEAGFLYGDDNFICSSYDHYLDWLKKQGRLNELAPDLKRKQTILDLVGFDLYVNQNAIVNVNGKEYDYKTLVGNSNECHYIPQTDLDELDEKVTAYIKALVQAMIIKNTPEAFDSVDDFQRRWKQITQKGENDD